MSLAARKPSANPWRYGCRRSLILPMRKFGITGGIASGKSTVAGMLRDLGFDVIDADSLARELMEPGQTVYEEVVHEFGRGVIDPRSSTGQIDRRKLAA